MLTTLLQRFVRGAYGEDVGVLPVILYSDETGITQGGINMYPVLMTLALPEALGGQHFHQRIAFLPCLTRTNLGLQIDDTREEERCGTSSAVHTWTSVHSCPLPGSPSCDLLAFVLLRFGPLKHAVPMQPRALLSSVSPSCSQTSPMCVGSKRCCWMFS